ncbi:DUF3618 domain-containing protein [Nonomuraea sp. NPDC050383]|uniref:DUF3618 domain-containing protein n=1 Tax=Nonomuraea sp. NPDC050383 TaxID=3364362 RepID=UPI00379F2DEC
MSETDPGYSSGQHAGDVGAHRTTVGMPTDEESINVPQTRAGAAENALKAEEDRAEHETFDPEPLVRDERTDAIEGREGEARSQGPQQVTPEARHGSGTGTGASSGQARETTTGRRGRDGRDGEDDDEEGRVRKRIEETRGQLGHTVAELAHKADVKHRAGDAAETAKAKAGQMAGTVTGKAGEVAGTVTAKAGEVAGTVTAKAGEVAGTVTGKAGEVAGTVTTKVREVTPDQVKEAADKVTTQARRRPALLVVAAGAIAVFVLRRVMRRDRHR